ncbi:hypothetical protein BDV98DRAFT_580499 [Pterulicium gracile]|uniref:Uncharacterized protein n=1 Tax=Pterulicium gracile TaxID=1884261 RepID=A0A5C3QTR9_9AGAR|nr:hypothetical protein BDV98DRAFT_580499 [Pterula gracilis]
MNQEFNHNNITNHFHYQTGVDEALERQRLSPRDAMTPSSPSPSLTPEPPTPPTAPNSVKVIDFGTQLKDLVERYMKHRADCSKTLGKTGWRTENVQLSDMKKTLFTGKTSNSRLIYTFQDLSLALKDDTTRQKVGAYLNGLIRSKQSAKDCTSNVNSIVSGKSPRTGLRSQADCSMSRSKISAQLNNPASQLDGHTPSPSSLTRPHTFKTATNTQEQLPNKTDFKESDEPKAQVVIEAFGSTGLSGMEGLLEALDSDSSLIHVTRSDSTEAPHDNKSLCKDDQELRILSYIVDKCDNSHHGRTLV